MSDDMTQAQWLQKQLDAHTDDVVIRVEIIHKFDFLSIFLPFSLSFMLIVLTFAVVLM